MRRFVTAVAMAAALMSVVAAPATAVPAAAAPAAAAPAATPAVPAVDPAPAPDATATGPYAVTSAEYRLPPAEDPAVIGDRITEIWARVYRPRDLGDGRHPVVVMLHGNHPTCGYGENPRIDDSVMYSTTGTCPPGYVVVPNHEGYGYLAERLASWGYVVVSVNANRGLNGSAGIPGDLGLNLARGRLVLRHLQLLSEWNTSGGTPSSLGVDLRGHLDFTQVGLFGHSRGGEGMRAAYNLYRDAGSPWPERIPDRVRVRGIFEIGPVDGQTGRVLDAPGTRWGVLLPMCDGDVFDLAGVRPFDRMQDLATEPPDAQKSTYTVWGANHNYFNTQWQVSDSTGCAGHEPLWSTTMGSAAQRTVGLASVLAFVRGNVGRGRPEFNRNFDPAYALPPVVSELTRVDRGFTPSPGAAVTKVVEDFTQPAGTSSYGYPNEAVGVTVAHGPVPEHDKTQTAGAITWTAPGGHFQTNWAAPGASADVRGYRTLDLRVSRQVNALNPAGDTTFGIQLVRGDGSLSSSVPLARYASLTGPVGSLDPSGQALPHSILQTVRVPLSEFGATSGMRGVRLTFDGTASGAIYVADIRLSTRGSGSVPSPDRVTPFVAGPVDGPAAGSVVGMRSGGADFSASDVMVTVSSPAGFPVRDELVALRVGGVSVQRAAYPESGDLRELTFTLTRGEWNAARSGDELSVGYGSRTVATFGALDKSRLDR